MKSSSFAFFIALVRQVALSRFPELQLDPETAKDCVEWYNNGDGESCEYVRDYFGIIPEQFHRWNPQYTKLSTSSSKVPTSTSSAPTLGPSPTTWTDKGCFVEDPKMPILDQNMSPNGDASLTVPKCKNSCYRRAYEFVGPLPVAPVSR
ncbi:hypothetical protein EK21DRAFT_71216 [Setomelanomma holmii]|uniref:LysM domain-containing protein n=1 Tax=Setomelanomma holmii TaxID=210430 RepID=A0A9P4LKM2_9PLEO|nr:hypothetical protein EK21DRAFT_71216 [Setomelanomma holmii]